jgi:hypothetical protein
MSFYLKVNPDQLPTQLKNSPSVLELNPFSHRMAFASNELLSRGFFTENNLSQLSSGQIQLPLLTWPFLDFILANELSFTNLVELGSGNSILWFSKIFENVVSYETNQDWCNQISDRAPSNCHINYISEPDLLKCDISFSPSDWLLIDFAGRRTQFIFNMLQRKDYLLPGVIILDNSDWYRKGAQLLNSEGYIEIPFFGFKSGQMHLSCTSLFVKNISNLKNKSSNFKAPAQCLKNINNLWDSIEL